MKLLRWVAWAAFMFVAVIAGTVVYLTDWSLRLSYWWREGRR